MKRTPPYSPPTRPGFLLTFDLSTFLRLPHMSAIRGLGRARARSTDTLHGCSSHSSGSSFLGRCSRCGARGGGAPRETGGGYCWELRQSSGCFVHRSLNDLSKANLPHFSRTFLRLVLLAITSRPTVHPPLPHPSFDTSLFFPPSSPSTPPKPLPPPPTSKGDPVQEILLPKTLFVGSLTPGRELIRPLAGKRELAGEALHCARGLVYVLLLKTRSSSFPVLVSFLVRLCFSKRVLGSVCSGLWTDTSASLSSSPPPSSDLSSLPPPPPTSLYWPLLRPCRALGARPAFSCARVVHLPRYHLGWLYPPDTGTHCRCLGQDPARRRAHWRCCRGLPAARGRILLYVITHPFSSRARCRTVS